MKKTALAIALLVVGGQFTFGQDPFWPEHSWSVDNDSALAPHGTKHVVRDTAGNFHVVFKDNNCVKYTMSSDLGMTWTTLEDVYVGRSTEGETIRVGLAVNRYNKPCVIWTRFLTLSIGGEPQYGWKYRYKLTDGSWSPIIDLDVGNEFTWTMKPCIWSFAVNYTGEKDTLYLAFIPVSPQGTTGGESWFGPSQQGCRGFSASGQSISSSEIFVEKTSERIMPYDDPNTGWRMCLPFASAFPMRDFTMSLLPTDLRKMRYYGTYRVTEFGDYRDHWLQVYRCFTDGLGDHSSCLHTYYVVRTPHDVVWTQKWRGMSIDNYVNGNDTIYTFCWSESLLSSRRINAARHKTGQPPVIDQWFYLSMAEDSACWPKIGFGGDVPRVFWEHHRNTGVPPESTEVFYQSWLSRWEHSSSVVHNLSNSPDTFSTFINAAIYQTPAGPILGVIPPETWAGLLWLEKKGAARKVRFRNVNLPDDDLSGDFGSDGKARLGNRRQVVIDDTGSVHLVCICPVNDSIYYVQRYASKPKWAGCAAVGVGLTPTIALDPGGGQVMLWTSRDRSRLYFARIENGKPTTPHVLRETQAATLISASCAVDAAGMLHILIEETADQAWVLSYGSAPISTNPSPRWQTVATADKPSIFGGLAIIADECGRSHMLYSEPKSQDIFYVSASNGQITLPVNVSESQATSSTAAVLDIDSNRLTAVWCEGDGTIWGRAKTLVDSVWNAKERIANRVKQKSNLSLHRNTLLYDDQGLLYVTKRMKDRWLAPRVLACGSPAALPHVVTFARENQTDLSAAFMIDDYGKKRILYVRRPLTELMGNGTTPGLARALGGCVEHEDQYVRCAGTVGSLGLRITYAVRTPGPVSITVYDAGGRLVNSLVKKREVNGEYSVVWNVSDTGGARLPSGVYFVRYESLGGNETQKVVVIR